MDYVIQMENLYKFFALSLNAKNMCTMVKLKRNFNNDLNLLGCFIKDFLTIENSGHAPLDENLYNDFIIYYEKNSIDIENTLEKLELYSSYYLSIVFEDIENKNILGCIQTINSCFALDVYPYIMKTLYDYYIQKIDSNKLNLMLKYLTDIVIKRVESPQLYNINLFEEYEKERLAS